MSVDVVGVFDSDFTQLFSDARPLKATIMRDSEMFQHPIEDGSTISDHRIIKPVELELIQVLSSEDYADVYQNIKAAFLAGDSLVVQTRVDTFPNMVIQAMPHEETPDQFDAVQLVLRVQQAIIVTVQFQALPPKAVAKPKDASTTKSGEKNPQATDKGSVAYQIFKKF